MLSYLQQMIMDGQNKIKKKNPSLSFLIIKEI